MIASIKEKKLWGYGLYALITALLFYLQVLLSFFWDGSSFFLAPDLYLLFFYYCCLYRPDLLHFLYVFLAGLCVDSVYGHRLGMTSFCYGVFVFCMMSQRKALLRLPFWITWGALGGGLIIFTVVQQAVCFVAYDFVFDFYRVIPRLLLTFCLYPLLVHCLLLGEVAWNKLGERKF
jgi:rod shape-determining protein MreD